MTENDDSQVTYRAPGLLPEPKNVRCNFSLVFLAVLVASVVIENVVEPGELLGLHDVTDDHSVVPLVVA